MSYRNYSKISPYIKRRSQLLGTEGLGFQDGTEIWIIGTPDDARDSEVNFNTYNSNGDSEEKSSVYTQNRGQAVQITYDSNLNLYFISNSIGEWLQKYRYYDYQRDKDVDISGRDDNTQGIMYSAETDHLYILKATFADGILKYDTDCNYVETITTPAYSSFASDFKVAPGRQSKYIFWCEFGSSFKVFRFDPTDDTFTTYDIRTDFEGKYGAAFSWNLGGSFCVDKDDNIYVLYREASTVYGFIKYDADFNEIWKFELPTANNPGIGQSRMIIDNEGVLYFSFGDTGSAEVGAIEQDSNGLNPSIKWTNIGYVTSAGGSVNISDLQVELQATGFLFTLHAVGAGYSILNKLNGNVVSTANPSPARQFAMRILPDAGDLTHVPRIISAMVIDGTDTPDFQDDILRPSSGYSEPTVAFDQALEINDFVSENYLRIVHVDFSTILNPSRGVSAGTGLDAEIVVTYTDATPDNQIWTNNISGAQFLTGSADETRVPVGETITLTNVEKIYLRVYEETPGSYAGIAGDELTVEVAVDYDY